MTKRDFFKRETQNRGNGRELYFTPKEVIEKIVNDLVEYDNTLLNRTWIDVCAADGRWEEVISNKGIKCISYDIEPLNDKVKQQDFLNMLNTLNKFIKYFRIINKKWNESEMEWINIIIQRQIVNLLNWVKYKNCLQFYLVLQKNFMILS